MNKDTKRLKAQHRKETGKFKEVKVTSSVFMDLTGEVEEKVHVRQRLVGRMPGSLSLKRWMKESKDPGARQWLLRKRGKL